ncbi:MAG TPA: MdtA/MuxA family multidrug efflux RND transporter periplasmic adaptor subunit [Acidiferrobacterales bacterium]|nr:MdtA/MuxA family multidrug efflux RND transporter periplasmic adaptor subunit [Acidiferrobacterales bacterium]
MIPTQETEKNRASPAAQRQKRLLALLRRHRIWLAVLFILSIVLIVVLVRSSDGQQYAGPRDGGDRNAARTIPVAAVPVRTGDINVYLNALGTVVPLNMVTVRSRVDGQLVRLLFQEGQMVQAGQLLAQIDPRPYQVMLVQAEGQMARDQALLANARLDLERYITLFAQDSIAKQQVDTQQALVQQYEGAVKVDQGQIDNARLQLDYARITAPIGGRVGLRQVDPGNIIHASDQNGLLVITQLQPITVLFTIPEDSLPGVMKQLRAGAKLLVDAYDRAQKTKLATGALVAADNQIDSSTGTIRLKAQFRNDDGGLFPNQFVNVRLLLDVKRGATLIPSAAIQRGAQGIFVYVVKADNTVTLRPVGIGASEGENAAIDSGLTPGELVVVDGLDKLRDGTKVELPTKGADAPPQNSDVPARKGPVRRPMGGT